MGRGKAQSLGRAHNYESGACSYNGLYQWQVIVHLLLDAYHATGDEFYYEAAEKVANVLIWGKLECGGWNYVFDFAGENSLKEWYGTVGKSGWRLEEFRHYYGNATYDDLGTISAAKFLLRMYVEKNDPAYKAPLEKVIHFILESQYPVGGWPQRYPLRYDHPLKVRRTILLL